MQIDFSPLRSDTNLVLERNGDTLVVNGVPFDFFPLKEGEILPQGAIQCDWLASDVIRVDGQLKLCVFLPHGPLASAKARYPETVDNPPNGPILLPETDPKEESSS